MSTPAPVGNAAAVSNGGMTQSNQMTEENLFKDDLTTGGQSKKGVYGKKTTTTQNNS